jgi:two-component system cell cycle response regulator
MDRTRGEKHDSKQAEPDLTTMKLRSSSVQAAARDFALHTPPDAPITERPPGAARLPVPTACDRATLMVLTGSGAGSTCTLQYDATTIGRGTNAMLQVDDVCVSRCHACITREPDGTYQIEDLSSTNGTFVSGLRIERSPLASGDRIQLGRDCVLRFAIVDEAEEALQRQLYEGSLRDALTALANRRCLFERLKSETWHARRERRRLALLAIDVDHFKAINDRFGHQAGDEVLRAIARAGSLTLRGGDLFARYGGEELAIIARDAGMREATILAERLRGAIAEMRVETGSDAVRVTVSIGVAVLEECDHADEGQELFSLADARLYEAKRQGRNRVCSSIPGAPASGRGVEAPLPP